VRPLFDELQFANGLQLIEDNLRAANVAFATAAPWTLAK
jgi:hypothetical protein